MMTQLQRDALKRAQGGDWLLADAMELIDRAAAFGVTFGGRMRVLAIAEEGEVDGMVECEGCAGAGDTECEECGHVKACEDCAGTGRVEAALDAALNESEGAVRFENLDGEEVPLAMAIGGKVLTVERAREVLRQYNAGTGMFAPAQPEAQLEIPEVRACA
jgi:hypothetical protein